MSGRRMTVGFSKALVCACALFALITSTAQARAEPHPHLGKLPGFPMIRGVIPVLGSKTAVSAHEKLVKDAFAAARARRASGLKSAPVSSEGELAECEEEGFFFESQDVCYRGGPVLRAPTLHLIFWQGPVEGGISIEPHVQLFTGAYRETVEKYFEDVAHDSGLATNVFAVDPQYGDESTPGEYKPGEYKLSFDRETDATVDTSDSFPTHPPTEGCEDNSEFSEGPCLLDSDIQKEITNVASEPALKWPVENLENIYVVLTPPGVGGCFEHESGECAYRQYCAYHSDFGGEGIYEPPTHPGKQTLYINLPFLGETPGCDSGIHPNSSKDNGADADVDTASHETNETITDPIGSQCDEENKEIVGCERNAWTDAIGQEVADKCLPPESTIAGIYGEPLGGNTASTLYNQLINGDHYYTQRVWSNEAGLFEGGCVQRMIDASFTVSSGAAASVPLTLDGSGSGAAGDPSTYWVWNFGGGEQDGTASPTISHTFAQAGEYEVGLTSYDRYGNAQATIEIVAVGDPPLPPTPPPLIVSPLPAAPIIPTEPVSPPTHLTTAQLAAKLGLPANGKKVSDSSLGSLGHGECPPACSVGLRLYAKLTTTSHKRRTTKLVLIGTVHTTIAEKGTGALGLQLNAKGRAILHKTHKVVCKLVMAVEGQEGGTWQITRSLTLTG